MSTLCAFGMTVTDTRHDYVWSQYGVAEDLDVQSLARAYQDVEKKARERLRADGYADEDIVLERSVDSRYANQVHELMVQVPTAEGTDFKIGEVVEAFHAQHLQQFTYNIPEAPVEFLHWRLTAFGRAPQPSEPRDTPALTGREAGATARLEDRQAYSFESKTLESTPVYDTDKLTPGAVVEGPAILQGPTTTIVLAAGDELRVTPGNQFLVELHSPEQELR
jgi:N-methylhydantoinase A